MTGAPGGSGVWIADTGPVIILAKIGRLDLLTGTAQEVLLPSPVVREIRGGSATDLARRAVTAGWGTRVTVRYFPVAVRSIALLDRGEQSVLALALKRPDSVVVLDDDRARKAAKRLGLPMIGTLGLIVLAKHQGLIPAVVPLIQAARGVGCYIAEPLCRQVALREGEIWP